MEQNVLNHNRNYAMGKSLLKNCTVAALGIGALTGAYALVTKPVEIAPSYNYANTQSNYGVLAVQITPDQRTGQAVINLDGFRVHASFDFEFVADDNGQLGSNDEAVYIYNFAVDQVFTPNGDNYGDFTNADDIRNMISIITAHIEKNKMVRGDHDY
ncbi:MULTISPECIES: hypothetical protein [Acinetobacter]|uniref:Uncharacterized protein n=1 Tax=Acinetobacter higginsii TaxID=70347 RepID=N8XNB2_9GAMM|nr:MULTISPECIES: hypothetical protein [Acinetobacter]ENV08948.1 hypothetical protein F966_02593 [Acinetobacter higginsii]NNP70835.1 hypothetical protein [Acinetobacter sp. Ac_5812]